MRSFFRTLGCAGTIFLLTFSACTGPTSSNQEIADYSRTYCQIADNFMQDFIGPGLQPQGGWEASYQFIQHYKRTRDAAQTSLECLGQIDQVPDEALALHQDTREAMEEIRRAAADAIVDVNNATNQLLFQTAINRYAERAVQQSKRLNDATQQVVPRLREQLQHCTTNMIR